MNKLPQYEMKTNEVDSLIILRGVAVIMVCFCLHSPADNPVFWTLAIEAHYYVFIGIFYTLLMNNTKVSYFIVFPVCLFLSCTAIADYIPLFSYLPFLNRKPKIHTSFSWILFIIALIVVIVTSWIFYRIFEDFSEKPSKRIKYKAVSMKRILNYT